MYSLNATGARAWELLSEESDLKVIEATIAEEFGVSQDEVRRDLQSLVEDLLRERLLERG
jgi:DeoR/GlpR family transcriptional regulator of sugar metabolism